MHRRFWVKPCCTFGVCFVRRELCAVCCILCAVCCAKCASGMPHCLLTSVSPRHDMHKNYAKELELLDDPDDDEVSMN